MRAVTRSLASFKNPSCALWDHLYRTLWFPRSQLVRHAITDTVSFSFQDPTLCHMRSEMRCLAVFKTPPCVTCDQWYRTMQFSRPYLVLDAISDTEPCSFQDPTLCHMRPCNFQDPTLCHLRSVIQYLAVLKTPPCATCDLWYNNLQF